jgi:hypothetical protein
MECGSRQRACVLERAERHTEKRRHRDTLRQKERLQLDRREAARAQSPSRS